jgi:hypothetical protein
MPKSFFWLPRSIDSENRPRYIKEDSFHTDAFERFTHTTLTAWSIEAIGVDLLRDMSGLGTAYRMKDTE